VKLEPASALALPGVFAARALELPTGKTRYLGQPVAVVAALTPERCDDALRALKAEFTPIEPWAVDATQSNTMRGPTVLKKGNRSKVTEAGSRETTEQIGAGSAGIVDATYIVPTQHHASLETHGVVVDFRGGSEATVYASTQATFSIAGEAATFLGLDASAVTAIVEHMGGGFGAKFGLGFEGKTACELAKELKRPIHLMLTRPDEFVTGGNRSGCQQRLIGGMTADGRLEALVARVNVLGGLSDGSFAGQPYIYACENRWSGTVSIYTHTDRSVAMRAPGHPQASFGIESMLDELAYKLKLDPLEVRKKNLRDPAYARQLDEVARAIGWDAHPNRTVPGKAEGGINVGIGFAVGTWGGGGHPECEVDVKIERDGSVSATVGSQDLGTGTRTYIGAIVAEEFGLELAQVKARIGSSRFGQANGSGGSTTTASLAPAVKHAAYVVRTKFAERLAPTLRTKPELVTFQAGSVEDAADATRKLTWKQACATLGSEGLAGRGTWQSNLAAGGVHGAQAAKVAVDTRTGHVQVLAMVGCQDCGLPLNRLAVKSQLNGGMIQALSYALLEGRVIDPVLGLQLNANLEDYKIAGTLEIPEMTPMIDDGDTRSAVIGMAEPAIIPGHSAIANAVHNACGARVRELPLTPDKVLLAMSRFS
jgi:xanthine dehydrogenase YagR molybdenum-binding subunit